MKQVITKDNSITFHSEHYNEHYHTLSGAAEEAIKKFVEPCIPVINNKKHIVVYDICFGLGYNTAALLDYCKNKSITIYAFENDPLILKEIENIKTPFTSYQIIKEFVQNNQYKKDNLTITLIIGDVRQTLKDIEKADIVFHDPFSPKKCPELWTESFFQLVFNNMNNNAILTTYSYARAVRTALKDVGFKVKDGPIIGRRSPSTIAIKD